MAKRRTGFRVVRRKPNQVEIIGVDLRWASRQQWQRIIDKFAKDLQSDIGDEFGREKVAGRHLLRNKPEYTAAKIRQGYDRRKGHRTNALQRALAGNKLYNIAFSGSRVFVTFIEQRLISRIHYAEYYADKKTQGGAILQVSKRMVDTASKELTAFALKMQKKFNAKAATVGGGAVAVGKLGRKSGPNFARISRIQAEAIERQEFARRAPFHPSVAGTRVRQSFGTARQIGSLQKQAIAAVAKGNKALARRLLQAVNRAGVRANGDVDSFNRQLRRILRSQG